MLSGEDISGTVGIIKQGEGKIFLKGDVRLKDVIQLMESFRGEARIKFYEPTNTLVIIYRR